MSIQVYKFSEIKNVDVLYTIQGMEATRNKANWDTKFKVRKKLLFLK